MAERDVPDLVREDVDRAKGAVRRLVENVLERHAPRWLLTFAGGTVISNAVAVVVLPAVAAAACVVVSVCCLVAAYYARRLARAERIARAWAEIALMTKNLELLEAEQRLDQAVLAIAGNPEDRTASRIPRLGDLRTAISYRLEQDGRPARGPADAAGSASQVKRRAQRQPAPRRPPDLADVRRRIERRDAEIAHLKAAREARAVSSNVVADRIAAETWDARMEIFRRTGEADRLARERVRSGRRATGIAGEQSLVVSFSPDGHRAVSREPSARLPEDVAQGRVPEENEDAS